MCKVSTDGAPKQSYNQLDVMRSTSRRSVQLGVMRSTYRRSVQLDVMRSTYRRSVQLDVMRSTSRRSVILDVMRSTSRRSVCKTGWQPMGDNHFEIVDGLATLPLLISVSPFAKMLRMFVIKQKCFYQQIHS